MSLPFKKICDDFGLTKFGVRHALEQYQIIITELTNGFYSKLTYDAPVILDKARECFEKEYSDMEPVRHGRWLRMDEAPEWDQRRCSECGDISCCQRNYCPNCGAKMDGDSDG